VSSYMLPWAALDEAANAMMLAWLMAHPATSSSSLLATVSESE